MKVYDIIHLIANDSYLNLPADVPIPCDLHVERIAKVSGIVTDTSEESVIAAWASVAEQVSDKLGRSVSLLRIDSIVWQVGQIISKYRLKPAESRKALINHFTAIGIDEEPAQRLATELTSGL